MNITGRRCGVLGLRILAQLINVDLLTLYMYIVNRKNTIYYVLLYLLQNEGLLKVSRKYTSEKKKYDG